MGYEEVGGGGGFLYNGIILCEENDRLIVEKWFCVLFVIKIVG